MMQGMDPGLMGLLMQRHMQRPPPQVGHPGGPGPSTQTGSGQTGLAGMMQNADPMMMAMLGSQLMGMGQGQGQPQQPGMIPPPIDPAAMTPPPQMAMGAQAPQMWPDRMGPMWPYPMGGIRG